MLPLTRPVQPHIKSNGESRIAHTAQVTAKDSLRICDRAPLSTGAIAIYEPSTDQSLRNRVRTASGLCILVESLISVQAATLYQILVSAKLICPDAKSHLAAFGLKTATPAVSKSISDGRFLENLTSLQPFQGEREPRCDIPSMVRRSSLKRFLPSPSSATTSTLHLSPRRFRTSRTARHSPRTCL